MHFRLRKNRVLLSLFIALWVAAALPAAALADAKLVLTPPGGVSAGDLTITVRKGFPTSYNITGTVINGLSEVVAASDDSYAIAQPGTYCYYLTGPGYYSVCKLFNVTSDDVGTNREIELTLSADKIAGNGYEPGNPNLANVPSNYDEILDTRDKILGVWTDEILAKFSTDGLVGYAPMTTPAFTETLAAHQFTSQAQMMSFLNTLVNGDSRAHMFILGRTANYSFDMPIVIVTTSPIPANATFAQAAKIIRDNGKLNVWHQGQIHPNEPAAGEAVLVMLQEMLGDYGRPLLDKINFIAIPRLNPDGSYLFTRVTYGDFDMNRDHMRLQAIELDYAHRAFSAIMPEVAMDSHEFTYYGASTDHYMSTADDIQSTPASSLNNNPAVNAFAMNIVSSKLHQDLKAAGLRNYHYGYTVNNPIGRAYYGLFDAISILIETRGIGAGRQNFPRRVFSQVTAIKSMTNTAAANAAEIRAMVKAAREEIVAKGRTYEASDTLALYQTASGNTRTPFSCDRVVLNMDGTERSRTANTLSMNDTVARSRTRPTAYIVPKDAPDIDLDLALYITDSQGGEYYEIAPGATVNVEQYYYAGSYNPGFTAGLRSADNVVFPNGAYVIPMDQVSGNVLGMLWEPDVNDSNGYNGTLAQSGIVSYDVTTRNYPYYRFTGDNPRTALPKHSGGGGSGGGGGGCDAGFGAFALLAVAGGALVLRRKD